MENFIDHWKTSFSLDFCMETMESIEMIFMDKFVCE